jgi:hypothetical protein
MLNKMVMKATPNKINEGVNKKGYLSLLPITKAITTDMIIEFTLINNPAFLSATETKLT